MYIHESDITQCRTMTWWSMAEQEYVDHGSCVYKFYIVGSKVMHSCRRSMPNAASLAVSSGSKSSGLPALVFDRSILSDHHLRPSLSQF